MIHPRIQQRRFSISDRVSIHVGAAISDDMLGFALATRQTHPIPLIWYWA
ncbi:MAG: hypothetical protein AAGH67_15780 [Cyanobacteria bacterium P01_H01_bin.162]